MKTKISSFFENPFNNTFNSVSAEGKEYEITQVGTAAEKMYCDKPYAKEYKSIYITTAVLSIFASLVSFATALFAFQSILYFTVGTVLSWGAAFAICALFEVLKMLFWAVTAKQKLRYKQTALGGIFALVLLHTVSLVSSGYGAYLIPSNFKGEQIKIDSLGAKLANADFKNAENIDNQTGEIDKQISALQPFILTPSGKKSSVTATQITTLQKQKTDLLQAKKEANDKLNALQITAKEDAAKSENARAAGANNAQLVCVILAVSFELIYILCTLFACYYLYRVYIDKKAAQPLAQTEISDNQPQTTPTKIIQPQTSGGQPAPSAESTPRKIGFFLDAEKKNSVCSCANCGKEFVKKTYNHKFCTDTCKLEHHAKKHGGKQFVPIKK
jgi:hypothetical protein